MDIKHRSVDINKAHKPRQGYVTYTPERAFLVAVKVKGEDGWSLDSSLNELEQLALAAGAEVVGRLTQQVPRPSHLYVGAGKLDELRSRCQAPGYDLLICDDELSPVQQRNLEEALKVRVVDRTALILDVFARQARTREGQLQVEMAQHRYLLPRLAGRWPHLERLGGGIGTRGPGESQLETDRRLVRHRLRRLQEALEEVRQHRALYRQQRQGMKVVSLVGYTNAGKSTLFNTLCGAGVVVEDKLFSTLDPTTRRLPLPDGSTILLTDTVGFIQKLPPTVVAAFRATLEELEEAHLLLHIVDVTHPNAPQQYRTVEETLLSLGLAAKPRLVVLNKIDRLARGQPVGLGVRGAVRVSALYGGGVEELLEKMGRKLREKVRAISGVLMSSPPMAD